TLLCLCRESRTRGRCFFFKSFLRGPGLSFFGPIVFDRCGMALLDFTPGGGRTHSLWLRRPTLYPVELRARASPKITQFNDLAIRRHESSRGAQRRLAFMPKGAEPKE